MPLQHLYPTLEERHEFPSTGLEGERGNPIRRLQCYIPRDIGDLIDAHQPDYSGVGGVLESGSCRRRCWQELNDR